eukprot:GEMP01044646.1.p1 GENE.GEMP01044646.1~~GEMP01044646.1.p1  ORF type:complete len:541 (+),score=117.07 GEMP01044646.1:76-1623(+)
MANNNAEVGHWSIYTNKHGVACSVIDESISVPRNASWENVLVASVLYVKRNAVVIGDKLRIEYKELKAVEKPKKDDIPKIVHEGGIDVLARVIELKYQWTRRSVSTIHVAYLLMPTIVEANMALLGLNAIRQSGLDACQEWAMATLHSIPPHIVKRSHEVSVRAGTILRKLTRDLTLDDLGKVFVTPASSPRDERIIQQQVDVQIEDTCRLVSRTIADWLQTDTPELHELWADFGQWGEEEVNRVVGELGVPLKYRFMLWPKWLNADKENVVMREDADKEAIDQIGLDLHRTFPEILLDVHREGLRRVLTAFAAENRHIGYCQSMNMIAALFLVLGFDVDTTYQMFSSAILTICVGYHDVGFLGLIRDSGVIDVLMLHLFPQAHQRLELASIPILWVSSENLLTMYTKDWPLHFVIRLWDLIFIHGASALISTILVCLDTFFPQVVTDINAKKGFRRRESEHITNDPADIMCEFRVNIVEQLNNTNVAAEVLRKIHATMEKVSTTLVEELRVGMS